MQFGYMMTDNDAIVAAGVATATMAYEFQKAFIETIGPMTLANKTQGRFVKLDDMLNRKVGEYDKWIIESVDGREYTFKVERVS